MNRSHLKTSILNVIVMSGLVLASCASVSQKVRIAPMPADLPVSASGSLYVGGRMIPASDLQSVKDFSFDKLFSPKMTEKEVDLMLSSDLSRLAQESGGNAIVNLTIAVLNVATGDMTLIWLERYAGTLSLFVGAMYLAQPSMVQGSSSSDFTLYGAILAGGGAALIGGSFLHESVGTVGYTFHISGTVVRY